MLRRSIRDFVMTRDFAPAFALRLLVKDLRLYAGEAQRLNTSLPSGKPTLALFEAALAQGLGGEDYCVPTRHRSTCHSSVWSGAPAALETAST